MTHPNFVNAVHEITLMYIQLDATKKYKLSMIKMSFACSSSTNAADTALGPDDTHR